MIEEVKINNEDKINGFDSKVDYIKKLYEKIPYETINELNNLIVELTCRKNKVITPKVAFILFSLAIIFLDMLNYHFGFSITASYFCGSLFFLEGLYFCLYYYRLGIFAFIFHGLCGISIMCLPIVITILKSLNTLNNSLYIKELLILSLSFIILGTIGIIIYNVSMDFRKSKYSLISVLSLFFIGILIILIVPLIFNITI
ncbi:MAG: hypothetical protein PUA90_05270 [bacterium]|nr:hypothetical protein [bacterium]